MKKKEIEEDKEAAYLPSGALMASLNEPAQPVPWRPGLTHVAWHKGKGSVRAQGTCLALPVCVCLSTYPRLCWCVSAYACCTGFCHELEAALPN